VRAVILAAGRGSHCSVTGNGNKCLAPCRRDLSGKSKRSPHVASTRSPSSWIPREDVRRACGTKVSFVINREYESTNSLYSLWLAREQIADGFVVLNGDVLFHDQLLWDLLTSRDEDALLMAARRGERYSDEEMKIRVRRGCVDAIAKTLDPAEADGRTSASEVWRDRCPRSDRGLNRVLAAGGA
jgi:choline kinase